MIFLSSCQAVCGFYTAMASAAPQKRMVSSFFITLASPHRATVTQQQPALQAHSAPARDKQHTAVRVSPSDNIPSLRLKKEDHSQAEAYGSRDSKGRVHAGASVRASDPQSPIPAQPVPSRGRLQEDDRGAAGIHDNIKTKLRLPEIYSEINPACN